MPNRDQIRCGCSDPWLGSVESLAHSTGLMVAAERLAFSRAAGVNRYESQHKTSFQNATDLGPRSGVGWNARLCEKWAARLGISGPAVVSCARSHYVY
jgi:hypothetical protein